MNTEWWELVYTVVYMCVLSGRCIECYISGVSFAC